jgi:hypothetical protein
MASSSPPSTVPLDRNRDDLDALYEEAQRVHASSVSLQEAGASPEDASNQLKASHPDLFARFPRLFYMLCDRTADLRHLKFMLSTIKGSSDPTSRTTNVAVGKHFVDAYVTPKTTSADRSKSL